MASLPLVYQDGRAMPTVLQNSQTLRSLLLISRFAHPAALMTKTEILRFFHENHGAQFRTAFVTLKYDRWSFRDDAREDAALGAADPHRGAVIQFPPTAIHSRSASPKVCYTLFFFLLPGTVLGSKLSFLRPYISWFQLFSNVTRMDILLRR